MKKQKEYYEYPKRTCRTLHHCDVCNGRIVCGQVYFDGGYGRRCHAECAPPAKDEKEWSEEDELLETEGLYER